MYSVLPDLLASPTSVAGAPGAHAQFLWQSRYALQLSQYILVQPHKHRGGLWCTLTMHRRSTRHLDCHHRALPMMFVTKSLELSKTLHTILLIESSTFVQCPVRNLELSIQCSVCNIGLSIPYSMGNLQQALFSLGLVYYFLGMYEQNT